MLHEYIEQAAAALVREVGRGTIRGVHRIDGGGNNRVYRLEADVGAVLLKHYHHDPDDGRDRAAAEFEFATFAWVGGVRALPEPLAIDHTFHLALFEFVDGHAIDAETIGAGEVAGALRFFHDLNALRAAPASGALRFAAEACFSADDHLGVVGARVRRAARSVVDDDQAAEARTFVAEMLQPAWRRIELQAGDALHALPGGGGILRREQRCLTPSDFGFHNALRRADGALVFHDFEYAGWDDPAKTVCDFFCQPQVPVSLSHWDTFVAGIDAAVGADSLLADRARILLDVYRIKWCCIALNEFQAGDARRRDFADDPQRAEARRQAALATARTLLAKVGESAAV
jgi:hypothetical protein